jgi:hypothetical protein
MRGGLLALEGQINRACRDFIIAGQKEDPLAPQLLMDNCRSLATQFNPEF